MSKKYLYEITDASGHFHCGRIEAASDSEALQRFDQDNLHYLSRTEYDWFEDELYEVVIVDSYNELDLNRDTTAAIREFLGLT